jgi:hypothetical protein
MDRMLPKSDVYPMGDLSPEWRYRAACIGQNPKVWVANRTNASAPPGLQRICAKCPVAAECLTEGLNECRVSARTNDTVGTRAGTSSYIRNQLYMLWRAGDLDGVRAELLEARWNPGLADEFIAQMPPPPGKKCPQCGVVKPVNRGFYRNKRAPDGRATWCKDCTKESNREQRRG